MKDKIDGSLWDAARSYAGQFQTNEEPEFVGYVVVENRGLDTFAVVRFYSDGSQSSPSGSYNSIEEANASV